MNNTKDQFQDLDLGVGSAAIPVKMEVVKVHVSTAALTHDYCKAFVNEARRKMPLTAELSDALTVEELEAYANYLLTQRIKSVRLDCPDWRKLKYLWIPSFLQYILSCVGEYRNREFGLLFTPVIDSPSEMSFEDAVVISDKISAYSSSLQMVRDAMPRGTDGDPDVMSCAIVDEYVRSYKKVSHPSATYVAAFMNAHLEDEVAFRALYRIQYDDLNFIRQALIANGSSIV